VFLIYIFTDLSLFPLCAWNSTTRALTTPPFASSILQQWCAVRLRLRSRQHSSQAL
jgi:hypothetical protein